ncbi:hypothetical protein Patl1_00813 [Pistacia atlantica]|uniref:Uncharacterized protein n=1 Tax=Pistacia atlantica TaxID=434234 RepID=A0ACC1CAA1_9ROSI|nr:hypothetical protein Patl1_00813 [Pistacia atlantica]
MALVVYWYDFVCFGIVAASFIGSLWVIWRKERSSRCDDNTIYESLIAARTDSDAFVRATPKAHVGSSQLWTSCWKGVHPGWLLLTRFVSLVAMAGFLSWDIADWGATIFVYYTEWTFTLVMIYFGVGTIVSAYGCWVYRKESPSANGVNGVREEFLRRDVEESITTNSFTYGEKEIRGNIKLQSHYAEEVIQHRAGFWGYLMQTIYQACAGAVILTDIIFWCVIVPFLSNAHLALNMLMGCMHTLNAAFLLLDSALNNLKYSFQARKRLIFDIQHLWNSFSILCFHRLGDAYFHLIFQPFPWFRLAYFVQWSCLYVVFQWVIHACGFSWWPYPFLELNTPWAPLWYPIVIAISVLTWV